MLEKAKMDGYQHVYELQKMCFVRQVLSQNTIEMDNNEFYILESSHHHL
jgi:hypothetical protein